jgi:aspartate carbamoyltransferase catalytic subunit
MLRTISTAADFYQNSFVSIDQLNPQTIQIILQRAKAIKASPKQWNNLAHNKLLYSLFFSQSTRTRVSTETAWIRLGGDVINVSGTEHISTSKGESWEHTLAMFAGYQPDAIAIRNSLEFLPHTAAEKFPNISWVNCGDGSNEHPTQAMLDVFTISELVPDLKNLTIAFVGDIKHGRTVKSLAKTLQQFGSTMYFLSPSSLHAQDELEQAGITYNYRDISELTEILPHVDIIYATRPQLERMSEADRHMYEHGVYQITPQLMQKTKARLMHPLPIDAHIFPEISAELDTHPQSVYFHQAANGLWVRMAIFSLLLNPIQNFA